MDITCPFVGVFRHLAEKWNACAVVFSALLECIQQFESLLVIVLGLRRIMLRRFAGAPRTASALGRRIMAFHASGGQNAGPTARASRMDKVYPLIIGLLIAWWMPMPESMKPECQKHKPELEALPPGPYDRDYDGSDAGWNGPRY
jgi:hypothetical protein